MTFLNNNKDFVTVCMNQKRSYHRTFLMVPFFKESFGVKLSVRQMYYSVGFQMWQKIIIIVESNIERRPSVCAGNLLLLAFRETH